jgi:hypothetical protein
MYVHLLGYRHQKYGHLVTDFYGSDEEHDNRMSNGEHSCLILGRSLVQTHRPVIQT